MLTSTVTHVLSDHSKIDKIKVLMANGTLMKVKSIVECSKRRATEGRIRRKIGANYKRRVNNGETLWIFAI